MSESILSPEIRELNKGSFSRPVSIDSNAHRSTYSTAEAALRQLVVDLTGQNANLRVDLETAVQVVRSKIILKQIDLPKWCRKV